MIDLLAQFAAVDPSEGGAESTDLTARVMAVVGWGITLVLFGIERRGKLWRGRREATNALRGSFDEVHARIAAAEQDSSNVDLFWTVPVRDALSQLRKGAQTVPDRRLRRALDELLKHVQDARGDAAPTPDEAEEPPGPLDPARLAALRHASKVAAAVVERLNLIERKGAAG